jgi:hypothetical protein
MAFDQSTRNRLQKFVSNARAILGEEFTRQLQATYGLDPKQGTVAAIDSLTHLDNRQRQTAHLLRETLAHYLATTPGKGEKDRTKQVLDRIVREQAFTVLNRLAALRMAEARGFLLESIAKAHSSKGFQLYRQLSGTAHGETGDAYRNYLFSLFDEFSLDLAVLFDRHSAQGRLFPRESALLELLAEINHHEIEHLWAEDETIGWIYQYFNSQEERKKMRAESQAPRNSRELAVRNQFFTPRYVVEFLTDNTLGRIWYEMTQGNTALVDSCRYLVRRPTEMFLNPGETAPKAEVSNSEALSQEELLKQPVYIPHRPLKDPRYIRMLDPACGSMHFGLYAFDLFGRIYLEAWQLEQQLGPDAFTREAGQQALQSTFESLEAFKQQIPKLIIEHNIYGVDIDPRAVQIAGLSLWQRAQRAWYLQGIKPQQRPTIVKSNIVCAEPMPGEKAMLQEFTSKLNPPVLGQLLEVIFDKMQLAGEAGTLLKIEEEIQTAIHEAREQWLKQSGSNSVGDLFQAELDAATPQTKLGFDLRGIDDEAFWDDAEQRILQALSDYADQAESNADQKRLFAEDAAKGFAFIDLCRKRFDVVLMNPPFGEVTKSTKTLQKNYFDVPNDLYCFFYDRGDFLLNDYGLQGAITNSSFKTYVDYEKYREKYFVSGKLKLFFDLGWNVLDDAYVETCAYVTSKAISHITMPVEFGDGRKLASKENVFEKLDYSAGNIALRRPVQFTRLSGSPLIHSWEEIRFKTLSEMNTLDSYCSLIGKGAGPHNIFYRLHWEVPPFEKGFDKTWVEFSNGGSFSPFWRDNNLMIHWKDSGKLVKAYLNIKYPYLNGNTDWNIQNEMTYGMPGITWGKKTTNLSAQYMQEGTIYSFEGLGLFPKDATDMLWILAFLNSRFAAWFLNATCGLHKNPPYLKALPIPNFTDQDKESLSEIVKCGIDLQESKYSAEITSPRFVLFQRCNKQKPCSDVSALLNKIDEIVAKYTGLTEFDLSDDELKRDIQGDGPVCKEEFCIDVFLGIGFGRWPIYSPESHEGLPLSTPSTQHMYDVDVNSIFSSNNHIYTGGTGNHSAASFIKKNFEALKNKVASKFIGETDSAELANYIDNPNNYFSDHLKSYTKNRRSAPIYWPLQTPSGSYTLWVYYHRLNEQTLYTCVNDFVEPKLEQVEQDLNGLRSKSARSSQEEKELEKLSDLASELRDFRDELLRLAKFWKPNLNDGVQITAAPLWKLFQHKAWQKKLKETWESLEKGDYDWAHLALKDPLINQP